MRPGIEIAKWAGVAAMLYDHLEVFSGWPLPFAAGIGALAFPLFAVALGGALAEAQGDKLDIVARRLLAYGVLAQFAVMLVRDVLPLNVLFAFAAGIVVYRAAFYETGARQWVGVGLGLALGAMSEFAFVGTGVVVAALAHYQRGASAIWLYAAAMPLFAFNEMQLVAPLGVLAGLWLVENGPSIPRVKRGFYGVYMLQYPLLRFL